MGRARREVGFWRAVGQLRLTDIVTVEFWSALAVGGGFSLWLISAGTTEIRGGIATNYLVVIAALLGIVFAGLALVVSLLSSDYLRLLQSSDSGILGFFRPFVIAIGLQILAILTTVFYVAVTQILRADPENLFLDIEPWLFGTISVLFVGSCLELVVLTRSVLLHAKLRAQASELVELVAERERSKRGQRD